MFLTQIYGTVLGGFVNYVVMISIVNNNRELLISGNGDASWSGATIQSYTTNATSWALAKYLYKSGTRYAVVPFGLLIGAGIVAIHWTVARVGALYTTSSVPLLTPGASVYSQDSRLCTQRNQFPSVHPIRWLHSFQQSSDFYSRQPNFGWVFRPVLSTKLPSVDLQGLLVLGHRRLGRRKSHSTLHPVLCCLWRWWSCCQLSLLVGQ